MSALVVLGLFIGWLIVAVLLRRRVPYFMNIYQSVDRLGNSILGGDYTETISSRIGKQMRSGSPDYVSRVLCWFLDLIDPGHCENAIKDDEGDDAVPLGMAVVGLVAVVVVVVAVLRLV